MTKALALCFFGLICANSGLDINIAQASNATKKEIEITTMQGPESDEVAAPNMIATNEAAAPEVNASHQVAVPPADTMIDKPEEMVTIDTGAAHPANNTVLHEKVSTDEARREMLAIARVRERSNEETEYAAVAAAHAAAENARTSMASQLEHMQEQEVSDRQKRESILKNTIDAALAGKSDINFLKRKPADNVTAEEAQAIERVQERAREEIKHKTIAIAIALAEKARVAAVAELEKMHENESKMRKKNEAILKDALNSVMANQA